MTENLGGHEGEPERKLLGPQELQALGPVGRWAR